MATNHPECRQFLLASDRNVSTGDNRSRFNHRAIHRSFPDSREQYSTDGVAARICITRFPGKSAASTIRFLEMSETGHRRIVVRFNDAPSSRRDNFYCEYIVEILRSLRSGPRWMFGEITSRLFVIRFVATKLWRRHNYNCHNVIKVAVTIIRRI